MSVLYFEDLGKSATSILSLGYAFTKRVSLSTATADGLTVVTDVDVIPVERPNPSSKGSSVSSDVVLASASSTYRRKDYNLVLDNFQINNNGTLLVNASYAVDPHLSLGISTEEGRPTKGKPGTNAMGLHLNYANNKIGFKSQVDVLNGPTASGGALFRFGKFAMGGTATVNTFLDCRDKKPELASRSLGAGVAGIGWEAAALVTTNARNLSLLNMSFKHDISEVLTVAASVDCNLKKPVESTQLVAGGMYIFGLGSHIKGKVGSDAALSLSYFQQMNKSVGLTLSTQIDGLSMLGSRSESDYRHKFGFNVAILPS